MTGRTFWRLLTHWKKLKHTVIYACMLLSIHCEMLLGDPFLPLRSSTPSLLKFASSSAYSSVQYSFASGITIHRLQFVGGRVRWIHFSNGVLSPHVHVRAVSQMIRSPRARAPQEWQPFTLLMLKIVARQSWFTSFWQNFNGTLPSNLLGMSCSGPVLDTTTGTFQDGMQRLKTFVSRLKTATISTQELTTEMNNIISWLNQDLQTKTVAQRAENFWKTSTNFTDIANCVAVPNDYNNQFGAVPIDFFHYHYIPQANLAKIHEALDDWQNSAIELLCVSNFMITENELASESAVFFQTLYTNKSPRNYKIFSGFSPHGIQSNITCPGTSDITKMIPIAVIDLGPLTETSAIASDILTEHFHRYANIPSMYFMTKRAIYSGCVFVIIRVSDESNDIFYSGKNRFVELKQAIENIRNKMTPALLSTKLSPGGDWEDSYTLNQEKLKFTNYLAWSLVQDEMTIAINWMTECFEGERSFELLASLHQNIQNGTATVAKTASDVHSLLEKALQKENTYCIWNYIGGTLPTLTT